jgi:hypothetical protein
MRGTKKVFTHGQRVRNVKPTQPFAPSLIAAPGLLAHSTRRLGWPLVNLRMDWSENPNQPLERAWEIHCPQMNAYGRPVLPDATAHSGCARAILENARLNPISQSQNCAYRFDFFNRSCNLL